ncbi:MAG TPA: DHH family phosphoesterase [Candidatus Saccharimonadales bacterium]|nr:DHH family phosphoesterase [Candidatus Saccharimonadales bacterium]
MTNYPEAAEAGDIISSAKNIVVVQADNPDTDSLASSLALEHILGDAGKEVTLYCGVELPSYLKYLPGADRVTSEFPSKFDAGIIVDTASETLLEQLAKSGARAWLAAKPVIVIDHHNTRPTIDFAKLMISHPAVATGEVIYELAQQLGWSLNVQARELLAVSILSDSLGLTTEDTTARSIHIIAELVDSGVSLAKIENARRETMKREPELIAYKGRLLERVQFHDNNRIATIPIPWEEIEKYSPLYNPSMLVIEDMRLARGTDVAIAFKVYDSGRVTAKIRANYKKGIAGKLAEHFGGGGHAYAAGFKIDGRPFDELKAECIKIASELLDELKKDEAV